MLSVDHKTTFVSLEYWGEKSFFVFELSSRSRAKFTNKTPLFRAYIQCVSKFHIWNFWEIFKNEDFSFRIFEKGHILRPF